VWTGLAVILFLLCQLDLFPTTTPIVFREIATVVFHQVDSTTIEALNVGEWFGFDKRASILHPLEGLRPIPREVLLLRTYVFVGYPQPIVLVLSNRQMGVATGAGDCRGGMQTGLAGDHRLVVNR